MTLHHDLSIEEVRVLGALLEKAVVTPEQCPLTLNALINACNQKSSRDPVLALDPGVVQRAARQLDERHLIKRDENFRSGVEKYSQRLCNTPFSQLQLSAAEYAVICLLLLRGRQTPGELRTRSGRLHTFADNEEVAETLRALIDREGGPLVARLPRVAGRQDHEYTHLFAGAVESVASEVDPGAGTGEAGTRTDRVGQLEARLQELSAEVADLKRQLGIGDD